MISSARPPVGSTLYLPSYGLCTVLEHTDPSTVSLRIQSTDSTVRIGERALRLALLAAEGDDAEARA